MICKQYDNFYERGLRSFTNTTVTQYYNDGDQIDEDTLPFLFDPYVKGVKGQFGLGLSIVSKIASLYDYQVQAKNNEVGVSFIFTKKK